MIREWMRDMRIRGAGLMIVLLLAVSGCLRELPDELPTEYEWKPLLAFPIGEADFGLKIPHGFDTLLLEIDTASGFPQWAALETIPLAGAIGFDFERVLGKRDEINMVLLRVNTYNGFPIELEIQAYLEDDGGEVLDSLFFPKMIMQRGVLQAGGRTVIATHTREEIIFDQERLDILLQAKKISFRGELNSVAYFPEYTFKVQLGAVLGIVTDL
ncbi:MAG: hypothetical protein P1P82_09960 [Bacteroidales bacterium]|nr:hypothetical protein [Bacteroidales bacterium]MDT8431266.1 hypothetical protein [Bacteroidales bacterium]